MKNVFVAPKIKVGFQKRDDTFTGQLAYIIYYDDKGKLRKETSWDGWRDKKIAPQEFDNTPMDGFTLNRDVQRSREWFGSGRNMIRIHDPRGFEFEVTCENLIEILMHTDCLRRGLIGEFVYAWVGSELVLLPTNSEEYQAAVNYTKGLSKKVGARELVPGVSYKTKREGDIIFMGKLKWHGYTSGKGYRDCTGLRQEKDALVFTNDGGKTFVKKPSASFLSEANSATPVSNFAELMDAFNKKLYANRIVKYDFRPVEFKPETKLSRYYGPELCRKNYFVLKGDGLVHELTVSVKFTQPSYNSKEYKVEGYEVANSYYDTVAMNQADGCLVEIPRDDNNYGYYGQRTAYTLEQMQQQKLFELYVTYESGVRRKVDSFYALTNET